MPKPSTAVVIPCHNYGMYLGAAIASVMQQSRLVDEIVVVDDSSTDYTRDVATSWAGVRYLRIDARHTWTARKTGYLATKADILCFLDADDLLAPDYFKLGVPCFGLPRVGIVYSDMHEFGDGEKRHVYPQTGAIDREHIQIGNQFHAGSLVSRKALEMSGAFNAPAPTNFNADWYLWKQVTEAGFLSAKSAAVYRYRIHNASQTRTEAKHSYYDGANLALETVTIFDKEFSRGWIPFVNSQNWKRTQSLDSLNFTHEEDPVRWYAEIAQQCFSAFALIIYGDTEPSLDIIETLMRQMQPFAAWITHESGCALVRRWALFDYALAKYDEAKADTESA